MDYKLYIDGRSTRRNDANIRTLVTTTLAWNTIIGHVSECIDVLFLSESVLILYRWATYCMLFIYFSKTKQIYSIEHIHGKQSIKKHWKSIFYIKNVTSHVINDFLWLKLLYLVTIFSKHEMRRIVFLLLYITYQNIN